MSDIEEQVEVLIQKSLKHSELFVKIQAILNKIVKDLYGDEMELDVV
jgi:hypothetical protein